HLWTLAVEEQYYIFYPLIFALCLRFRFSFGKILLTLFTLSFLFNLFQFRDWPVITFYSLHTRFWELCMGGLIAYLCYMDLIPAKFIHSKRLQDIVATVGLLLFIIGCIKIKGSSGYTAWKALIPIGSGSLLILTSNSFINKNILSARPLVFIGLVSYTWYLWHWPLLAFSRELNSGKLPSTHYVLLIVALGLLCSLGSYFLVEQPIRRKKITKPLILSLVAGIAICAACGGIILYSNGLPSRISPLVWEAKPENSSPYREETCSQKYGYRGYCVASPTDAKVAFFGDSHGWHLAAGLNARKKDYVFLGQQGTPPLKGLVESDVEKVKPGEQPNISLAYKKIVDNPNIKTVFLVARWNLFLNKRYPYYWLEHKNIKDRKTFFEVALEEVIQGLLNSGKKVILMYDVPEMEFRPEACVSSRPLAIFKIKRPCGISLEEAKRRAKQANSILQKVALKFKGRIEVYDPSQVLCPNGFCWSVKNNMAIYKDNNHLSNYGSKLLVDDLMSKYDF
ncbi:MAG: acyltransferase, partial [Burkholderiales bacterium]|nr:acyltransferase [Burkholderiales bacterium]